MAVPDEWKTRDGKIREKTEGLSTKRKISKALGRTIRPLSSLECLLLRLPIEERDRDLSFIEEMWQRLTTMQEKTCEEIRKLEREIPMGIAAFSDPTKMFF